MNKDKSSIFVAKNASDERLEDFGKIIGVSMVPDVLDYLPHKLQIRERGIRSFDDVIDAVSTS